MANHQMDSAIASTATAASNGGVEEAKDGAEIPSTLNKTVCEICHQKPDRYKCPDCLMKYCALQCFKNHKRKDHDVCDSKRKERKATDEGSAVSSTGKPEKIFASDYCLPSGLFEGLTLQGKTYRRMTKLLRNKPHVRDMIRMLDECVDPRTQIPICMQNEDFAKYARFMMCYIANGEFPDSDSSSDESTV